MGDYYTALAYCKGYIVLGEVRDADGLVRINRDCKKKSIHDLPVYVQDTYNNEDNS